MKNGDEVLVVDDNPENLRVISSLLIEEGYHVRVAKNGKQALDTIDESAPDIILMDVQMPEMDGFEVCKKIKSNPDIPEIPVLFISALGDSFNKVLGFESGGVDYIPKPFDAEEVKARVRVHIDLKKSLQEIKLLKEELRNKTDEIAMLRKQQKA